MALDYQYRIVVHNDEHHTIEYVMAVLRDVFDLVPGDARRLAHDIDQTGSISLAVKSERNAYVLRDAIFAYGPDALFPGCVTSLVVSIEDVGSGEVRFCGRTKNNTIEDVDHDALIVMQGRRLEQRERLSAELRQKREAALDARMARIGWIGFAVLAGIILQIIVSRFFL